MPRKFVHRNVLCNLTIIKYITRRPYFPDSFFGYILFGLPRYWPLVDLVKHKANMISVRQAVQQFSVKSALLSAAVSVLPKNQCIIRCVSHETILHRLTQRFDLLIAISHPRSRIVWSWPEKKGIGFKTNNHVKFTFYSSKFIEITFSNNNQKG